MEDAMVTGRMSAEKKAAGARVLAKAGLNASQAINLLYDKLEEEQNADFLLHHKPEPREWESALQLIEAIHMPINPRFDTMSKSEIKRGRLAAKGLM